MTLADSVVLSRELREDGQIDGQVKLYNVEHPGEFESDAALFFERTLMTNGLREALSILYESLDGQDPRGTHVLYGPYGSGKSHQMVAMYHCFDDPSAAATWAGEELTDLDNVVPADATTVTVAMQHRQYEYLWEPFFDAMGEDPGSYDTGGYPDMQHITDAVGTSTVAFFIDELEGWFETLSGDRKSANKGFLQALLEATAQPDLELYTIVSVLRDDSEVHDILDREQAVQVNMNNQVDKRDVLRHRLIESVDPTIVADVVGDYMQVYEQADRVEVPDGLARSMQEWFPFHPVLLDALEDRYYRDEGNQNARGMIYLFSKLLLEIQGETDLITHGDVDTIGFEDELAKINYERQDAAMGDIKSRLDETAVPHGRRILNTILLYSLDPAEGEGARESDIIMGACQTGDRVSDVMLNLEQLHGKMWHLHKLNGRYAIRERENPIALIRNAASEVSEQAAKAEIADVIREIFGDVAHPVGFRQGDMAEVPDTRDIKVLIKDSEWTKDDVTEAITNQGRGREWRNTLVFVQPASPEAIESGTRYVDKARFIEAARQVLQDPSLEGRIRESVHKNKLKEEQELREELQVLYGEVLDGDDLLNEFDQAAAMPLDVFVGGDAELDTANIAESAAADPLDLRGHIWPITEDLLDRRGQASIQKVYEAFLRTPELPIPRDVHAVLGVVGEELDDKPVLAREASGFSEDLSGCTPETVIVRKDAVESWEVEDVIQDLRERFGGGETAIDIGDYELGLIESPDIWIDGDNHDVVMRAIGRLIEDEQYVVVHGTELLEKPRSDATIRDVGGAERIGASGINDRIDDLIAEDGRADMAQVIGTIRADDGVFLPPEETETAVRQAVYDHLVDEHLLWDGDRFGEELGDRDPAAVTLVPTVPPELGESILSLIDDYDPDDQFTVTTITDQISESVGQKSVETFLKQQLGKSDEPAYVIGPSGSDRPADWVPGDPFRRVGPDAETWRFEYNGDSVADLRTKWQRHRQAGHVEVGDISYEVPGEVGTPDELRGAADIVRARVNLTLGAEQDANRVQDLLERMPDEARGMKIEVSFTDQ